MLCIIQPETFQLLFSFKPAFEDFFFFAFSSISLVKMVYKRAEDLGREPGWKDIEHAIRRNFGGLDEIDPVKIFKEQFPQERRQTV